MSTLNLLSGLLTPDLLRTAAKATGETEAGISKALGAAFPAVLGQLVQGSGNSTMMSNIIEMAKSPAIAGLLGPGGGILAQVGSLLSPSAASGPVGTVATSLLSALFGKNASAVAGAIGSLAGLKSAGSASSLLGLAGPMVLSALGSRLGKSMTGTSLAVLLGQEKNAIMAAIPSALSGALSMAGSPVAPAAAPSAAPAAAAAAPAARPAPAPAAAPAAAPAPSPARAEEAPGGGSTFLGSILGLLLTGAIIAAVVFGLSQCNKAPPAAKAAAPSLEAVEAPRPA